MYDAKFMPRKDSDSELDLLYAFSTSMIEFTHGDANYITTESNAYFSIVSKMSTDTCDTGPQQSVLSWQDKLPGSEFAITLLTAPSDCYDPCSNGDIIV